MSRQYQVRNLGSGEVVHFEKPTGELVSVFPDRATAGALAVVADFNGCRVEVQQMAVLPVFVTRIRETEAGTYRWVCEASFGPDDPRNVERAGIQQTVVEAEMSIRNAMACVIRYDVDLDIDVGSEYQCRECHRQPGFAEFDGHCAECVQKHEALMAELGV